MSARSPLLAVSVCLLALSAHTLLAYPAAPPSSNKGKIEGTKWSSRATTVKCRELPAGALKLDFKKNGDFLYTIQGQQLIELTGRYEPWLGDYVYLHMDKPLAGRKTHLEKIVIKNKELTMIDSDGTKVTFELVKD
jgi:hypothetical protein